MAPLKNLIYLPFLAILLVLAFVQNTQAATLYSTGVSNWLWSSSTSWTYNSNGTGNCACTPSAGDIIIIRSVDSISVPSNITVSGNVTVQVYGVLNITGFLELSGTSSVVNIYSGGHLSSNGSPSSKLRIGGTSTAEYTGADGTLTGPWTIQNGSSASNTTLPVTFISFTGSYKNDGVQLQWATSEEKNNLYFEIQKSTDGKHFTSRGRINPVGTGVYSYTDGGELGELNYYRLLQMDGDGTVHYSPIITVAANPGVSFRIESNVGQYFKVVFDRPAYGSFCIQDLQGRKVFGSILNGVFYISGEEIREKLPAGIYIITVQNIQKIASAKLVIE